MNSHELQRIVVLASDHNGVYLKEAIKAALIEDGHWPIDIGPYSERSVDYVDYAKQAATMVSRGDVGRGILICGTGVGMSIVANKVSGVRSTVAHNLMTAKKCREHNDTNMLCLGAWVHPTEENEAIALAWLNEPYGEYRHVRRVAQIDPGTGLVFTNGCFDILHRGHVELLRWASGLGSKLIVGLDTDESIRALKGAGRPVNPFVDRKAALESIRWVDQVLPFDDLTRRDILDSVRPSILVKGGEWTADEVRRRDSIPDGVDIRVFPLILQAGKTKYSTTGLIEHLKTGA